MWGVTITRTALWTALLVIWGIVFAPALIGIATLSLAWGHPGRLDAEGCHRVRAPEGYAYKSGVHLPAGSRHCHRALGRGLTLDGQERLAEPAPPDLPAGHAASRQASPSEGP